MRSFQLSAAFVLISRNFIRNNKPFISHQSTHRSSSRQNAIDLKCHPAITIKQSTPLTVLWTSVEAKQHVKVPLHQSSLHFHTLQHLHHRPTVLMEESTHGLTTLKVRHKSKKKQYDSEEEDDSDFDDNLDEDDFEAPSQFKVQTIHAPSLRIDAIISKALGLSRHRLEEVFFGPGILLNGKKLLKKGGKMDEGDYVDVVMEKTGDQIKVKRVKLLKVSSQRTNTDKLILRVRIWKAPFSIDNPQRWKHDS